MNSHIHFQAMADAKSGANTETYSEPATDYPAYKLIVHTAMSLGACIAHKMGFSEDRIGTVEDFKTLNKK